MSGLAINALSRQPWYKRVGSRRWTLFAILITYVLFQTYSYILISTIMYATIAHQSSSIVGSIVGSFSFLFIFFVSPLMLVKGLILPLIQTPLLFAVVLHPSSVKPVRWLFYSFIVLLLSVLITLAYIFIASTGFSSTGFSSDPVPISSELVIFFTWFFILFSGAGIPHFILVPLFLYLQRAQLSHSIRHIKRMLRVTSLISILLLLALFVILVADIGGIRENVSQEIRNFSSSNRYFLLLLAIPAYSVIVFSLLLVQFSLQRKLHKLDLALLSTLIVAFLAIVVQTVILSYESLPFFGI